MRLDLAALIDHTLLRPDAVRTDFERLCKEAAQHSFATVCVNSAHVALCTALLEDCQLPVAATVGFPLGAASKASKSAETDSISNPAPARICFSSVSRRPFSRE